MIDGANDEPGGWPRHGERIIVGGPEVWLSEVDVGLPTRERVWLPVVRLFRSAAVALVDDMDRVLLVRRYRFAPDRWGWELPGGQVEEDEDPAEAAARELEDLTGFRAGRLDRLAAVQPAPEIVDSERFVFLGRDPVAVGEPVALDAGERADWKPLGAVPGLMAAGEVWNSLSVVGLLGVLLRQRGLGWKF